MDERPSSVDGLPAFFQICQVEECSIHASLQEGLEPGIIRRFLKYGFIGVEYKDL